MDGWLVVGVPFQEAFPSNDKRKCRQISKRSIHALGRFVAEDDGSEPFAGAVRQPDLGSHLAGLLVLLVLWLCVWIKICGISVSLCAFLEPLL